MIRVHVAIPRERIYDPDQARYRALHLALRAAGDAAQGESP